MQSIKFFLVAVVVVVVVESLSPKNLNVNSFSLKEFCKLRSKHPINFNFFSLARSLCLFAICSDDVTKTFDVTAQTLANSEEFE